ncbi:cohesin loading factor [Lipomyces japonicus]|uniref:cohesin loading factor n=1 Tax=Lipomyces japonicus TaxID=56871 RepID=UPI0034CF861B
MATSQVGSQDLQVQVQHDANPDQASAFSNIHLILFPLAQEYFHAAHANSNRLRTQQDVLAYYKHIATGIRCLEAVLKERVPPYVDCLAALWYSEALFNETDNWSHADEVLNKGIAIASRNNLYDVKFTMLHLSVRMLAQTSTKAASKLLDVCQREARAFGMPTWIYTFQYLTALLQFGNQEYAAVIHTLKSSFFDCSSNELRYVSFLTCALVQLKQDNAALALEYLTRARHCETDYSRTYVPQLVIMRMIFEVIAIMMTGDVAAAEQMLASIHQSIENQAGVEQNGQWPHWHEDGSFIIALPSSSPGVKTIPIKFRWWGQSEVLVITYLLSGVVKLYNSFEKRIAIRYLSEGFKAIDNELTKPSSNLSYDQVIARQKLFKTIKLNLQYYTCLERLMRNDWSPVELEKLIAILKQAPDDALAGMYPCILYLVALYFQGTGRVEIALELYNLVTRSVGQQSDYAMLSMIAIILIYKGDIMRNEAEASRLAYRLQPLIDACNNKAITCAWQTVSMAFSSASRIDMQNQISALVATTKTIANSQLTTIVLYFAVLQFTNHDRRETTSRAAFVNAKKTRDILWSWMTGVLASDVLKQNGKELMAEKQRELNQRIAPLLADVINPTVSL